MIVNVRGTGGSGKSTVVKRIMELYSDKTPVLVDGRKQPYYYYLTDDDTRRSLVVPGHYEIPTGGCDTIKTVDEVYAILDKAVESKRDAIFEGIIAQDDVTRAVNFANRIGRENFLVIVLSTPLDACIAAINDRRAAKGNTEPVDPKNTTNRAKRVTQIASRLKDSGLTVEKLDREAAFLRAKRALGMDQ